MIEELLSSKKYCLGGREGPCPYGPYHSCSKDENHSGMHQCKCGQNWIQWEKDHNFINKKES